jgi:hypothetical protein
MDTIKLHYAPIDLQDDIYVYEFHEDKTGFIDDDQIYDFIQSNFHTDEEFLPEDIVFLVTYKDEIYITDNFDNITRFLKLAFRELESIIDLPPKERNNVYLYEYPSFEEAYTVALMMKEENKLCYSSETKDSPYWNKFINNQTQ